MRVGVLGAGLSGTLVALEMADAGHDVKLIDRKPSPLAGASGVSEGKIHLGYVYAVDRSQRTARAMARAAATFRPLVERWVGRNSFDMALSSPFLYAVHRNSLIGTDAIRHHFGVVSEFARDLCGDEPNPECSPRWRELAEREYADTFDPRLVMAAFATEERAIMPGQISSLLVSALCAQPRIVQMMGHHVDSVSLDRGRFIVSGHGVAGPFRERFDVVTNALWEHRLRVDAILGHPPHRPVVHRFKYGLWTNSALACTDVPSVTFLLGSFGDYVSFNGAAYASWYPAGLASQEVALSPATQDFELTADERTLLISRTLDPLAILMPGAAPALSCDRDAWTPKGGFITAWGRTGIDDVQSELHERYQVGVHSDGNWHSIDTGKLAMAPMFAAEACARMLASHGAGS
jgi:hypothetical protein